MPTRRLSLTAPSASWLAVGLALTATLVSSRIARAQESNPTIADVEKRSGLVQRFVPIEPHLPTDPRRDQWYDTRWGDPPNLRHFPNFYLNGGLYGLRWKAKDTQSYLPYFYGAPGDTKLTDDSRPVRQFFRPASALLHPFKPVGMYYEQGSYVPVYDLDPVVPGPGPMVIPWFRRLTNWGG